MMDKQIEEMARHLCLSWKDMYDSCEQCTEKFCCAYLEVAEELTKAGYRKIPEGAVVIPKEISCYENIEERVRTFRLDGNKVDFTDGQIMALTQILHFKERNENEIRKETVNKFASRLKNHRAIEALFPMHVTRGIYKAICEAIDEIAKEITEGK